MKRKQVFQWVAVGLVTALSSGCVTVEMFKNQLAYEPVPMRSRVEARVSLDVTHTVTPAAQEVWRSWGNGPETIGNWELAVRGVIIDDVVKSGLFASAQADGVGTFDYLVRIRTQDLRTPDRFSAELQVCDWGSKAVVASYKQEQPMDGSRFEAFQAVIQNVMARLKADVLADAAKGNFLQHGGSLPQSPDQHAPPTQQSPELQPQI